MCASPHLRRCTQVMPFSEEKTNVVTHGKMSTKAETKKDRTIPCIIIFTMYLLQRYKRIELDKESLIRNSYPSTDEL